MTGAARCLWLLAVPFATLASQEPPRGLALPIPVRMSGQIVMTGEGYRASGIDARRPGELGRMSLSPQLTLFGTFSVGLNILVSSEGSQFRQNISQFGISPRWKWATFHAGDFSQNYSAYTVQGTRLRGGGVDLRPGIFRLSLQGGRSQRVVAGGAGNQTFRRNLYAGSIGVGREQSSFLDLLVLTAKDDPSSLDSALRDTLLLDTIPVALRPRYDTRPQENLVLGSRGQVSLFGRRFVLAGEGAVAVITRDVQSPAVDPASVTGGDLVGGLIPLTLSSSGDYAFKLDGTVSLGPAGLKGGYEYVGAGFTSLGLAYVINDRRAYNAGGNVRLLRNRVSVQGQYQHQNDNLLGQKATTTNRNAVMASVSALLSRRITATLTGMNSVIANDAAVDTFVVDSRSLALTANTALQASLGGMRTTVSMAYAFQRTADANVITRIPQITVHNVSTSIQLALSKTISVTPSVSYAVTNTEGGERQSNVHAGFRGQGRFGNLRPSVSFSQTYNNGRAVTAATGQLSYALPWEGRVSLQARHSRYAAIGNRPAFQESFLTLSLARSF